MGREGTWRVMAEVSAAAHTRSGLVIYLGRHTTHMIIARETSASIRDIKRFEAQRQRALERCGGCTVPVTLAPRLPATLATSSALAVRSSCA